jgi:hypothetical protein
MLIVYFFSTNINNSSIILILTKRIGKSLLKKNLDISLNVRDVLAQKLYYFQDRNENKKLDLNVDDIIWTSKFGRIVSLNL